MFSNLLCIFYSSIFMVIVSGCVERRCSTDNDCKIGECCIIKLTGNEMICKDMGDDIGDVCGGDYFCSRCSRNLVCIPIADQGFDLFGCPFPANGTCQQPPPFPLPVQNSAANFDQVQSEPKELSKESAATPIENF